MSRATWRSRGATRTVPKRRVGRVLGALFRRRCSILNCHREARQCGPWRSRSVRHAAVSPARLANGGGLRNRRDDVASSRTGAR